jgi:hypothetical protein
MTQQFGLRSFAGARRAEQYQPPDSIHAGGRLAANRFAALQPSRAIAHWGHAGIMRRSRGNVAADLG